MVTLKLSLMGASEREMTLLFQLLKEFESRQRIRVEPIILDWTTAWDDLQRFATYRDGPDVSVVGNSWITTLRGMQALRPFSAADVKHIGGADAFLSSLWNTGCSGNQVWAIPWQVDTRAFFYWRSALAKAGVDERTAFASCDDIARTVAALVDNGQVAIVGATKRQARNSLINMAGWVWTRGGEFWDDAARLGHRHPGRRRHGLHPRRPLSSARSVAIPGVQSLHSGARHLLQNDFRLHGSFSSER